MILFDHWREKSFWGPKMAFSVHSYRQPEEGEDRNTQFCKKLPMENWVIARVLIDVCVLWWGPPWSQVAGMGPMATVEQLNTPVLFCRKSFIASDLFILFGERRNSFPVTTPALFISMLTSPTEARTDSWSDSTSFSFVKSQTKPMAEPWGVNTYDYGDDN